MGVIEQLCREAGVSPGLARARAEDAVVRIEGGLVVSAGTGDPGAFRRAIAAIRATLLAR